MARALSSLSKSCLIPSGVRFSTRSVALRSLSTVPPNPDIAGDDSSSTATTDPLLRKLEDVIHRLIVRRSAPDWLPFLPGHSYWVPPPKSASASRGIAQLLEKLANPLSPEESLSTTTARGWPSSDYFIKGVPPPTAVTEIKIVPVKVETETNEFQTEEDEG